MNRGWDVEPLIMPTVNQPIPDLGWVHRKAREPFRQLTRSLAEGYNLGRLPVLFKPFETYRTPMRQLNLQVGATNASEYQSAHQFGLAVDFVVWTPNTQWSWDDKHPWHLLRQEAQRFGLDAPIAWDRVHIEHPLFKQLRAHMLDIGL